MKFYKENNINPAASCLPLLAQFPVFIALYLTLQALRRTTSPARGCASSTLDQHATVALVGLRAARDLRRLADRVDVLHGHDDGQDAAQHHDGRCRSFFITVVARFPTGLILYWVTTNLWTVGQGLSRAGSCRRRRRRRSARSGPKPQLAHAPAPAPATGRRRRRPSSRSPAVRQPRARASGRRAARAGERRGLRRGDRGDRRRGEVEGAARSRAARARARQGAAFGSRSSSEGERGLLGVGYTPARVVASADASDAAAAAPAPHDETRARGARARARRARRRCDRRRCARRRRARTTRRSSSPAPAATSGLLIGKHGQTIDALQYIANAIVWRARRREVGDGRRGRLPRPPPRDARGDRAAQRRAGAQRGERVALEPMTPSSARSCTSA